MSAQITSGEPAPPRWRATGAHAICAAGAVAIVVAGFLFSRPDIVALALPLALWSVLAFRRPASTSTPVVALAAEPGEQSAEVRGSIRLDSDAEIVQLCLTLGPRHRRLVDAAGGVASVQTRSHLLHSGPSPLVAVTARLVAADGAWVSTPIDGGSVSWHAAPRARHVPASPLAPRLRGVHGSHEGDRSGHGGDFRDIHPFGPGDELRRVDWRATARLARRADELFIRRTNALSDASVVLMLDTADELGRLVSTWGLDEPERSGPTSLDLAREAARTLATAAIDQGDRVAFHELHPSGRSLRSGAGPRQLSRIVAALAATGPSGEDPDIRRTPPVPVGSLIYVLSTFFVGSAQTLALSWSAAGNRVIAVDTLPVLDRHGLDEQQSTALRVLLAERRAVFQELRLAGVEVLTWGADADATGTELLMLARGRR